jgi:dephospho-CoA kinase
MIIGITGTNGSGKGTLVEYLIQKGFQHYSAREFITEEVTKRGLLLDRNSLRSVANDLRMQNGSAYVIESLFKKALVLGGDSAIESIRALGEAQFLKSQGALLIAIDADRALRYARITERGSATDKVAYATWVEQEEREWHNENAHDMNVRAVMAMADFTIQNNGTLEELHAQIEAVLSRVEE